MFGAKQMTLYLSNILHRRLTAIIVYVDDIVTTKNNMEEICCLKKLLVMEFEIKDLGSWGDQEKSCQFLEDNMSWTF